MRAVISFVVAFTYTFLAHSQPDPVSWEFKIDTLANGSLAVNAQANIEEGWKLYAHNIDEGGPIPTDLVITNEKGVGSDDKIAETGDMHGPEIDDIFEVEVSYFTSHAEFSRNFTLHRSVPTLTGYVLYMVCDDNRCLPPKEVPFELNL